MWTAFAGGSPALAHFSLFTMQKSLSNMLSLWTVCDACDKYFVQDLYTRMKIIGLPGSGWIIDPLFADWVVENVHLARPSRVTRRACRWGVRKSCGLNALNDHYSRHGFTLIKCVHAGPTRGTLPFAASPVCLVLDGGTQPGRLYRYPIAHFGWWGSTFVVREGKAVGIRK